MSWMFEHGKDVLFLRATASASIIPNLTENDGLHCTHLNIHLDSSIVCLRNLAGLILSSDGGLCHATTLQG